ncbi:MAG: CRISPR-associated endonuclease Cas2 [Candidatus Bathyarchaeia archaeon]
MYVIMIYDVGVERVSKVLQIARKYLHWVQNSVLEGEITDANFLKLQIELSRVIEKDKDSITFYVLRTTKYLRKSTLGTIKGSPDVFL